MLVLTALANLALGGVVLAQTPVQEPPPDRAAAELADSLTRRLGEDLHVKAVVGKPVAAGAVTVIPILMIDINFAGGTLLVPGGAPGATPGPAPGATPKTAAPQALPAGGGDGFLMSGEARPLGFVVVTRRGTRFISVTQTAAK